MAIALRLQICDVTSSYVLVIMAALCNRGPLYFLPCNFFLSIFLSDMCGTRLAENAGPKKVAKNRHLGTITQLCLAISSQPRHVSTIGKKLLSSNMSSTRPHNMANFGPLAAEIGPVVWGAPANFHGIRYCMVSSSGRQPNSAALNRGATYVRQGHHHVGHWPTGLPENRKTPQDAARRRRPSQNATRRHRLDEKC